MGVSNLRIRAGETVPIKAHQLQLNQMYGMDGFSAPRTSSAASGMGAANLMQLRKRVATTMQTMKPSTVSPNASMLISQSP